MFPFRRSDPWLGLTIFGLVLFGIVMIYSASVIVGHTVFGNDRYFVIRQIIWAAMGLVAMGVMASIDYQFWRRWAGLMLAVTFVLLFAVFFFSNGEILGAHRWITLFGQSFQPSELAKLTFIIYLSAWLVERQESLGDIVQTFIPYVVVLLAISILMLKQPDFGTLTIILVPAIAIYWVAGLTWKQVGIGACILVVGIGAALYGPGGGYRRERLSVYLSKGDQASSSAADGTALPAAASSYHSDQIAIAIGSGGWRGLGFGQSRQKRRFLPEPQTDSIFAIITEELGFVWAEVLILAYALLIWRGYLVAMRAPDMFGRLLAVGITSWFAFQTFINLGAMVHLVPLVGVPLPFVSYGGTNLVISLLAAGLLLNISRHSAVPDPVRGKASPSKVKTKRAS
jgi:cell division protein FtsW